MLRPNRLALAGRVSLAEVWWLIQSVMWLRYDGLMVEQALQNTACSCFKRSASKCFHFDETHVIINNHSCVVTIQTN